MQHNKSTMSSHQEDLDLLLSLQDRVLETPPGSPSNHHSHSGYLSDESPRRHGQVDLSVFRDAVQDCLDHDAKPVHKSEKLKQARNSNDVQVEKYSGLRIRNQLVTPAELSERLSDIRFVRLPAIKNLLVGDTLSGCWATIGVLTEKGNPRTSSVGKSYCIWKIGCLDENTISLFLFGDAYQQNCKEQAGTVFALFNCTVRRDNAGGFSLSVYSPNQIIKMGTSIDYGVCKGKRKDGMSCTVIINKRQGIYCRYHKSKASEVYSTTRTELRGGNLKTAFRDTLKSQGIYLVDPLSDKTNINKPVQPLKLLSVEGLKKALSNADKVTTNTFSQGIRFLNEITGKMRSKNTNKASATAKQPITSLDKRKLSTMKVDPSILKKKKMNAKKMKTDQGQVSAEKAKHGKGKMIELDIYGSDEEI
ncbi:protein MCM10 homolog [Jatropha curcas]|uniref:protein MCM10 homolog n=1 Tax=Jatropha curcas TaxID=180498 RepID=UPI0009D75E77|nr:protein MCM10 homolog [Jatropha curcas]